MVWTADRIRTLRRRLGLTQEGFARRLNVTLDSVRRWEQGRSKPSPMAEHLLDVLEAAK